MIRSSDEIGITPKANTEVLVLHGLFHDSDSVKARHVKMKMPGIEKHIRLAAGLVHT